MKNLINLLNKEPFSIHSVIKQNYFLEIQKQITYHHKKNCIFYNRIINDTSISEIQNLDELPALSVNLFKEINLYSIKEINKFKTLTSSGTSGKKSEIILDRETALLQQKALTKISGNFLGNKRLPMLIVENEKILNNSNQFSASAAAIRGFSIFGKDKCFILDEYYQIDQKKIDSFLKKYKNEKILIFGFTFQIWKSLIKNKNFKINNKCIVLHGGGWKKMQNISVNNMKFKKFVRDKINAEKIIDYYGMVEQVGSIFMECEKGFFHCSNLSDILIRNEKLDILPNKQLGIIQMMSLLPWSYPGHNILTEDLGTIHGEDDCKCGRFGKYFTVFGRVPNSEIRGCSDTGISG